MKLPFLRRADEMEQYQSDQSAKYGFIFYTVALLVWALYDWISTGDSGWQFSILLVGCAVYFWSRAIYNRRMSK
ncbi:hypothetical protein [Paenibacillus physcomitrellae]|uniref:Uncharacterized protein n=1 Tax=Paenibacillus physcomitrellae TaxID=1619311 RepID=A0ABQ1GMN2_9BACL|nr:hypothetical protein [Paenibacillus physcomitrellae]GGA46523.1 hypothetical protein GCM10010917_34790 [Paenibacillus physcomitrellae]